jgi:hypothetical protein
LFFEEIETELLNRNLGIIDYRIAMSILESYCTANLGTSEILRVLTKTMKLVQYEIKP